MADQIRFTRFLQTGAAGGALRSGEGGLDGMSCGRFISREDKLNYHLAKELFVGSRPGILSKLLQ